MAILVGFVAPALISFLIIRLATFHELLVRLIGFPFIAFYLYIWALGSSDFIDTSNSSISSLIAEVFFCVFAFPFFVATGLENIMDLRPGTLGGFP